MQSRLGSKRRSSPRLRLVALACVAAAALIGPDGARAADPPKSLLFHASSSGQPTLDQGEGGGNPFASALIKLLARRDLPLGAFPAALAELTARKSRGFQAADVPAIAQPARWQFQPMSTGERRIALVLVISDYAASGGAQSLPGAAHDANRVAQALRGASFDTQTLLDPTRATLAQALGDFAKRSAQADIAVLYATGHGVEVGGQVYLLPGDYPVPAGNSALAGRAVRLSQIAASARARRLNLVFYGGCRDNPFGN